MQVLTRTADTGVLRMRIYWYALLCLGALLLALAAYRPALAQSDEPVTNPLPAGIVVEPNQTLADDGGPWELGVEGTAGNLTAATAAERYGMYYWLNGWFVRKFNFNEATSWETDYKRAALGGNENNWTDSVDLSFYVGHGSPGTFTFDNINHNDKWLSSPNDCNASWGDNDNEWLALTSCQVLAGSGLGSMAQCMNRQHLILGFVSNASAHNNWWETQSYHFGRYMRFGYNMTQSWFNACDVAQRDRVARVIAEETACFNDNPYSGFRCADSVDNDYYWYTHNCGTASANTIPLSQLGSTLPVFTTQPLDEAETKRRFAELNSIFAVGMANVTDTGTMMGTASVQEDPADPPRLPTNSPFLVSQGDGVVLQMDKSSGLYQFTNTSALWTEQSAQAAMSVNSADANYVDDVIAIRNANAFLNQNKLMAPGAQFYQVISDTTGSLLRGVSTASVAEDEVATNWQVIYTRVVTPTVVNAAGVSAQITFTVVGPGAKLKVYEPLTTPAGAAGVSMPLGVQGGWRPITQTIDAASGLALSTPILDEETIKKLYLALDDAVTMNTIPLDIKSREILSATIAYWEAAAGSQQGQMFPVYELKVRFVERLTDAVSEDFVYLPASTQFMKPLARILNPPILPLAGISVTLTAADPAKTIKANGLGDFDFVMAYDTISPTFTIKWFMGEVTTDGSNEIPACEGKLTCTVKVPAATAAAVLGEESKPEPFTVSLLVIDETSPNASESSDAAQTAIGSGTYLPTVKK